MNYPTAYGDVKYYTVDGGIVVQEPRYYSLAPCKINGVLDDKVNLCDNWWFIPDQTKLETIEEWVQPKEVVIKYVLQNEKLQSDNIPLVLYPTFGAVPQTAWNESTPKYWDDHSDIQTLYTPVFGKTDGCYKAANVAIKFMGHISGDIGKPLDTTFDVYREHCRNKSDRVTISIAKIAHYRDIDRIFVPEFALHHKPCMLTAADTYRIIRTYVLDHIDSAHAKVTSDYDFCFTVQKKVHIHREDLAAFKNLPRHKRPKFSEYDRTHQMFEIFEIAPKPYNNYTVVDPFQGDNLEDLVNNINNYLAELIDRINMPYVACKHCEGKGYIL